MSSPRNDDPDRQVDTIKIRLVLDDVESFVVVVVAGVDVGTATITATPIDQSKINERIEDYWYWLLFAIPVGCCCCCWCPFELAIQMMACWKRRKMRKTKPTRYFLTRDAIDAMIADDLRFCQ
jgi:hypothetical protein